MKIPPVIRRAHSSIWVIRPKIPDRLFTPKAIRSAKTSTGNPVATPYTAGRSSPDPALTARGSSEPKKSAAETGQNASENITPRSSAPNSPMSSARRVRASDVPPPNEGSDSSPRRIIPTRTRIGPSSLLTVNWSTAETPGADRTLVASRTPSTTYVKTRPSVYRIPARKTCRGCATRRARNETAAMFVARGHGLTAVRSPSQNAVATPNQRALTALPTPPRLP